MLCKMETLLSLDLMFKTQFFYLVELGRYERTFRYAI